MIYDHAYFFLAQVYPQFFNDKNGGAKFYKFLMVQDRLLLK